MASRWPRILGPETLRGVTPKFGEPITHDPLEGVPVAGDAGALHVRRERLYVRSGHDAEYCLPTCGSLAARSLARLTLFARRESVEALGLAPCGDCRPDLHALER